MYVIIRDTKADKLKKHARDIKELACTLLDCFDELKYEKEEDEYSRSRSREDNRREDDDYEDDYEDDDRRGRRMTRRASVRGRGRY